MTICTFFSLLSLLLLHYNFQNAALEVIEKEGYDKSRVFVWGGSHGGFLTCHLVGQYPVSYSSFINDKGKVTNEWSKVFSLINSQETWLLWLSRMVKIPDIYKSKMALKPVTYEWNRFQLLINGQKTGTDFSHLWLVDSCHLWMIMIPVTNEWQRF